MTKGVYTHIYIYIYIYRCLCIYLFLRYIHLAWSSIVLPLKVQKELYEVLRVVDWLWKPPCSNGTSPEASARAHQLNQTEACKTFELPLRLKAMNSTWMNWSRLHMHAYAHTRDKHAYIFFSFVAMESIEDARLALNS